MQRGLDYRKYSKLFLIVGVVLFGLSLWVHVLGEFVMYRGIRGLSCVAFLGCTVFASKLKTNPYVVLFFLLHGISSFLTIKYEHSLFAILALSINFIAYLVLIVGLLPKINFKKINFLFGAIFVLLVAVNAYLLVKFIVMIKDFALNDAHYSLMMLGAMALVITGFFSLLYNHQVSSRASLVFTLFVFVLIFSEVFRAMGYYDLDYGNYSVYIARALLLLGLSLLAHYELISKTREENLGVR